MLAAFAGALLLLVSQALATHVRSGHLLSVEASVPGRAEPVALPLARTQTHFVLHLHNSAAALAGYFARLGYLLPDARDGGPVPRVYLSVLPPDLDELQPSDRRKSLFLRSVLPLVLRENERLRQERDRLETVRERLRAGLPLAAADALWLAALYESYDVRPGEMAILTRRVDVVPPSLALAQAATESAWGTSRFLKEGNALFGMWTWSEAVPGMVPLERDEDSRHRVRAFSTLEASVRAYIRTLNTHRAYGDFRLRREALRRAGRPLAGLALVGGISRYSEQREVYTGQLRAVILANGLHRLDGVALGDAWTQSTARATRALPSPALIAQEPLR